MTPQTTHSLRGGIFGDQDIPLALALPGGKQPAKGTPEPPGPKGHRHAGFGRSLARAEVLATFNLMVLLVFFFGFKRLKWKFVSCVFFGLKHILKWKIWIEMLKT